MAGRTVKRELESLHAVITDCAPNDRCWVGGSYQCPPRMGHFQSRRRRVLITAGRGGCICSAYHGQLLYVGSSWNRVGLAASWVGE